MVKNKFGNIVLVGKPNVGKSSLVNALVKEKVSIISNKAQTTRDRILGILTEDTFQMVFIDTPGVHRPHTQLGKTLNSTAEDSLSEADIVLVVVDGSRKPIEDDFLIARMLKDSGFFGENNPAKLMLCMNKMDNLKAENVEEHLSLYTNLFHTEDYMMTSVLKDQNIDKLKSMLLERLPEGDPMYPADEFTNTPLRKLVAEIIREKALHLTKQEVPHALACVVDGWDDESDPERPHISAFIVVEKNGQKAIMIGNKGDMIKKIGMAARKEIESIIGKHIYLELFVKCRPEWRQNPRMLRELGYL